MDPKKRTRVTGASALTLKISTPGQDTREDGHATADTAGTGHSGHTDSGHAHLRKPAQTETHTNNRPRRPQCAHTYYNVEKLGRTQCTQTTLDRHTQATRTAHNGSLAVRVPGRGTTCLPYISYVFTRHSHARRAGRPRPQSSHGRSILSQVSGRKPAPHIAILLSRGTSGAATNLYGEYEARYSRGRFLRTLPLHTHTISVDVGSRPISFLRTAVNSKIRKVGAQH